MGSTVPISFQGETYEIATYALVILGYIVNIALFYRFSKVLRLAAIRSGKKGILATFVPYSPLVFFPVVLFLPLIAIRSLFGNDLPEWVLLFGVVGLPPYFIYLFWYCQVTKEDIELINGREKI